MPAVNSDPDWKRLELLVAAIQRDLAPEAKVTHNAKVQGVDSEVMRQIDVLVEQHVGQYPMRVVIDCKDYASPVDAKGVEEFIGLVRDVRAHRGAMVCPSGFTSTAKKLAKKNQIELYRPADTDPHKWQVQISVPVACDFRATGISFGVASSAPMPLQMPERFFELPAFDEHGQPLGTLMEIAAKRWANGDYPSEPGDHDHLPLLPGTITKIPNGYGDFIPVDLTVGLRVTRQRYYGACELRKVRGLIDEQTQQIITNAFTVGGLDPEEVQRSWKKLAEGEEPPVLPIFTAVGRYSWGPEI